MTKNDAEPELSEHVSENRRYWDAMAGGSCWWCRKSA